MSRQCTTHHHACDCRERQTVSMITRLNMALQSSDASAEYLSWIGQIIDEYWRSLHGCNFNDDKRFKP